MDEALLRAVYGGDVRSPLTALTCCMVALTVVGSGWPLLAVLPLFFVRRARRMVVSLALTVGAQLAAVDLLKVVVGRTRPWIALGLHPILHLPHGASFPSGHAAGSFTVAAYLVVLLFDARRDRGAVAISVALFALAAAIAASRVYLGAHWPSDVLAGAVLGLAAGVIGGKLHLRAAALGREPHPATL